VRPSGSRFASIATLRVDRDDDALVAKPGRRGADKLGLFDRCGVERDLVGAGVEHGADVIYVSQPAADGQRHEAFLGGRPNEVVHDAAALARCGDVEENQLIGTLRIVALRHRDGVADIGELTRFGFAKLDAARDLAVVDVEAGNDAAAEHEEWAGAVLWLPLRVRERGALGLLGLMRCGAGCSSRAVP